jgi:hypothetical protein
LRAASINAGVTVVGGGAAARIGSAKNEAAIEAVVALSTSRLDQFQTCTAPSL